MKAWKHFCTINHHKILVMRGCFQVGLIRQGLLHDLSKYSPTEFIVGCRYYQGNMSPNNAEREAVGYSSAWLHHKGRNRHHFEYWIDYCRREDGTIYIGGCKMPKKYVAEMFCDRIAACRVYQGDAYTDASPYDYYQRSKDLRRTDASRFMHPETAALLDRWLLLLKERGEEAAFAAIRAELADSAY